MPQRIFLSKSKIAAFEQCPKRLWLEIHRRDLAQVTPSTSASFQVGHDVGAIACAAYPDGVMIAPDNDLTAALQLTSDHLAQEIKRPLFEATLSHEDVLVRVDLLIPHEDGWHMAEVKSTGGVKAYQLGDLATQLWVARGAGIPISRASIRHIDTSFVYETQGDYERLLIDADIGEQVADLVATRREVVTAAKAVVAGPEPEVDVGDRCSDPFECQFMGHCNSGRPAPAAYPVTLLPGKAGKAAARTLLEAGLADLAQAPEGHPLLESFTRIHAATLTGVEFHDAAAFRTELDDWTWPRFYLDFETISFAIPRWLRTRPYQAIPFQFSCHIEQVTGDVQHHGFLDLSGQDPSEACAMALLATLGQTGAIVTYNAAFERSCILGLARRLPTLEAPLTALAGRIVDLLPVVRRHYYHRSMRGSYSIKAVLPARLPQLSYADLDGVQDGMAAQEAYVEAVAEDTAVERKAQIRGQLEAYCTLDTWAMLQLARSLSSPREG